MVLCMQNLIKLYPFIFKMSKNQILTSIKVCNSVANWRKRMHYNPNVELVNGNVYAKFCLNLSIHSHDIEEKPNYDGLTE